MNWIQKTNPAWLLAGAAFFTPIKPAPVNMLLMLTVILVLLNARTRSRLVGLFKHPIVVSAYALVAWLLFTLLFESSDLIAAESYLSKYLRLLLLPMLAAACITERDAQRALAAFCMGVFVSVLGSYAVSLGFFASFENSKSPLLFKLHITHNFFVALAAGYVLYRLSTEWHRISPSVKIFIFTALTLSLYNFFFMVEGRSGWVAIAMLPVIFAYQRTGFRGCATAAATVAVVLAAVYFTSDSFNARVSAVFVEVQQWIDGHAAAADTNSGRRITFWFHSVQAFMQAPWFGYGVGGFQAAVAPYAQAAGLSFEIDNPHNQYLLLAVQGGLVAVVLYFLFVSTILVRKDSPHRLAIQSVVLVYLTLNLFNSFHHDFAEGVFFIIAVSTLAFRKDQA
ncbi:MAG TPA: O-antigen ligase family protein [Pseudomonadales bacterium]|nr:O-antigen ligase family protein [Pseudomonadales bacterium]